MSIDFTTDSGSVLGYAVTDRSGGQEKFATYDAAVQRLVAVRDRGAILNGSQPSGDEYRDMYDVHDPSIDVLVDDPAPVVNMCNRNAWFVGAALGITPIDGELSGSTTPIDFLGRVLLAQAISPADAGTPAYAHPGTGGRFIEGDRPTAYLQDRLDQLRDLAEWAIAHGRDSIWWG